jgi:DNA-binding response OmpR family regulator
VRRSDYMNEIGISGTILIIESDPDMLALNKAALTVRGYRVVDADTIGKGRALFKKEAPDAVILDIEFPDGNGLSLCEELRVYNATVPILFLSGLNAGKDIVAGLEAGGNDYILKPYDIKELTARVMAHIRTARSFAFK